MDLVTPDTTDNKQLPSDADVWPSNLPPPGEGRHWERKPNPAYTGGPDKWIYFTVSGQFDELYPPHSTDVPGRSSVNQSEQNVFTWAGYKWLGPGTDIEYNVANNVQPVNALDEVARGHDLAYWDIRERFEAGEIDYKQASDLVRIADDTFVKEAGKLSGLPAFLSKLGMSFKEFVDGYLGPSYAGLRPEKYNTRKDPKYYTSYTEFNTMLREQGPPTVEEVREYMDYTGSDALSRFLASYVNYVAARAGVVRPNGTIDIAEYARWFRQQGVIPDVDPRSGSVPSGVPTPGAPGWGMPPDSVGSLGKYRVPYSVIDVSVDQNNNGVPDVLERRHRRKFFVRRHRYAVAH